jgi:hypothetical protein
MNGMTDRNPDPQLINEKSNQINTQTSGGSTMSEKSESSNKLSGSKTFPELINSIGSNPPPKSYVIQAFDRRILQRLLNNLEL